MVSLFFLLSGEHPTLPSSELLSILHAENLSYKVVEQLDQVLRIQTEIECVDPIAFRAAMTRKCCLELFSCAADKAEITMKASEMNLDLVLKPSDTIMVRIDRVKRYSPKLDRLELERNLGASIIRSTEGIKVDLNRPKRVFLGVITGDRFIFGLILASVTGGRFVERNPMKRPYFHPSTLPAKMARCMVNLAAPKPRDLVTDFFCGTGGILIEAGLIGCKVLGVDVSRRMIRGAMRNLRFYHVVPEGLIVADSRHLPVERCECIVTDPPYGRSASTLGSTTFNLVEGFLHEASEIVPSGNRVCIASPKIVEVGSLGLECGFKHLESHFVYIHRSLTREIAVLEAQ